MIETDAKLSIEKNNQPINSTFEETPTKEESNQEYFLKPNGLGSNNCVISGKFTESGFPIICNDPHLLLNSPSFWYLAQIKIKDKYTLTGGVCAGLPSFLIGSNGITTWGITNSLVDTNDIWRVKKSGNYTYTLDGRQYAMRMRMETFKYDGKEVQFEYLDSPYGPVLNRYFDSLASVVREFDPLKFDEDKYFYILNSSLLIDNAKNFNSLINCFLL